MENDYFVHPLADGVEMVHVNVESCGYGKLANCMESI